MLKHYVEGVYPRRVACRRIQKDAVTPTLQRSSMRAPLNGVLIRSKAYFSTTCHRVIGSLGLGSKIIKCVYYRVQVREVISVREVQLV